MLHLNKSYIYDSTNLTGFIKKSFREFNDSGKLIFFITIFEIHEGYMGKID